MLVPLVEIVHKEKGAKGGPTAPTGGPGAVYEKDGYALLSDDNGNAGQEEEAALTDGQQRPSIDPISRRPTMAIQ